jgi:two-component system sensor kinase FixL
MDRLFEPFVTTKAEGLGLGLSMSRTIIAAHGGRMWAENNTDRGVTMHFLLPASGTDESIEVVHDISDTSPDRSIPDVIPTSPSLAAQPVTMSSK